MSFNESQIEGLGQEAPTHGAGAPKQVSHEGKTYSLGPSPGTEKEERQIQQTEKTILGSEPAPASGPADLLAKKIVTSIPESTSSSAETTQSQKTTTVEKKVLQLSSKSDVPEVRAICQSLSQVTPFAQNHPLYQLDKAIAQGSKDQIPPGAGAFFQGLDAGMLSESCLRAVRRQKPGGKFINQFDFKVSHQTRSRLEEWLPTLEKDETLKALQDAGLGEISISHGKYSYEKADPKGDFRPSLPMQDCITIDIKNMGKITIGTGSPPNVLRNRVTIQMDADLPEGEGLQRLHTLLKSIGLGDVVMEAEPDTAEKMKMAMVFRTFYPKEAYILERSPEWEKMSLKGRR
jgi:hypothetical protein